MAGATCGNLDGRGSTPSAAASVATRSLMRLCEGVGATAAAVERGDGARLGTWPANLCPMTPSDLIVDVPADHSTQEGRVLLWGSGLAPSAAVSAAAEAVGALVLFQEGFGARADLDDLVVEIAGRLMPISGAEFGATLAWLLETIARQLGMDTVFYRRSDHLERVTILVDEFPRRIEVPVPDPLGTVHFDADPVFGQIETMREVLAIRPPEEDDAYRERVKEGSGVDNVSLAMVPLLYQQATTGVLGLVHFGDRAWPHDELNALRAIASLLAQVEARIEAEARLTYLASHDELTGLANRRGLLDHLQQRLCEKRPTAVIFIDLDRFKTMNDFLGHGQADRLLSTLAQRLRTAVGPEDLVARLGGDEFIAVIDGNGGLLEAAAIADKLLGVISQPVHLGANTVSRTASLGIALADLASGVTAEDLLGHADAALYSAKAAGRNRATVFDIDLRNAVQDRSETEVLLREVIDRDGLRLHYHPEVDLRTGRILAVEALVRWNHPDKGLLPAGAFITVAEESGLVVDLGKWVLGEACRQLSVWRAELPAQNLIIRVNVSPAQLASPSFYTLVADTLALSGVPPSCLSLEVTEHAVMMDVERSLALLGRLRALGVGVAIDDFGTGFSSMAQLKRLPIDTIKIDRGFVSGLGRDPADAAIIDSIVRLSTAFGLELVAEGVEVAQHVNRLLALGCWRGQGFGLALPAPADEIGALLVAGCVPLPQLDPVPA